MPFDTDLPPDGADERPIRVSIVDDDPFALRMLRSYLDSSPRIEVLSTFTSASDVLPFLRRMRHDVLITDMRMPGMNGLELLTRVKKESPDVAVIVLTSFDDDSTMILSHQEGPWTGGDRRDGTEKSGAKRGVRLLCAPPHPAPILPALSRRSWPLSHRFW